MALSGSLAQCPPAVARAPARALGLCLGVGAQSPPALGIGNQELGIRDHASRGLAVRRLKPSSASGRIGALGLLVTLRLKPCVGLRARAAGQWRRVRAKFANDCIVLAGARFVAEGPALPSTAPREAEGRRGAATSGALLCRAPSTRSRRCPQSRRGSALPSPVDERRQAGSTLGSRPNRISQSRSGQ